MEEYFVAKNIVSKSSLHQKFMYNKKIIFIQDKIPLLISNSPVISVGPQSMILRYLLVTSHAN